MLDERNEDDTPVRETTAPGATTAARSRCETSHIDPQGIVHIHGVSLRPSDLCSPQFTNFYVSSMASEGALDFRWPIPARTASRAEWDRFDAWLDQKCNVALLEAARRCYPVELSETHIGGVRVGIVSPIEGVSASNEPRVLINLHGGGFWCNRGLTAGQLESVPVAAIAGMRVVTLDYRQAPFFRHPAGSEDVQAVYVELLKHHRPESIALLGCSAGAALAAQSIARFDALRLPRPGAIGMFGMAPPPPFGRIPPWGRGWGDSGMWYAGVPKNEPAESERELCLMANWYMEDCSDTDTTAYPGSSDEVLAKFPPTLFLTGARDFASSTVIAAHSRFLKLGVDAALYIMEGAPHAAHVYAIGTPEAHDAHVYVARWLDQKLAR